MKRKPFSGILAGILVSLTILSCGSAPPPVETPPVQPAAAPVQPAGDPDSESPDQTAIDHLNQALAQADTSRKQAQDIAAPGYFPREWALAEDQYTEAKRNAREATLGEVKKTIALYEAVVETYDNLARQCLPRYYEDLSGEILQARDEAVDAGIRDVSPDRLEVADLRIDEALDQYETGNVSATNSEAAKNYYAAAESAFDALDRYRALTVGVRAYRLEEEIRERGFEGYDPEDYEFAQGNIDRAVAAYDGGDTKTAGAQAEEALRRYTEVLSQGWIGYTGELRLVAETGRRDALNAKANVAVKREFDHADGLYTRANAAYNAGNYEVSAEYFSRSIPLFSNSVKTAEQKRIGAEEAIRTAETRIGQSEETAREAETVLQGGAQ
ncbi:MAG: hypothetical protein LBK63_01675 [Treponema sp.]|jgi:hypothetical protein|nr:hypothetical protein [Treponema sp.]